MNLRYFCRFGNKFDKFMSDPNTRIIEKYYPKNLIPPKTQFLVEELLK